MKNSSIKHIDPLILPKGKKVYFLSDAHLGAPDKESSRIRENKLVDFLSYIENDAHSIYLVGDMFDFWFEHKYSAPKGFVRLLGKLAQMRDAGINIHFFTGNHDMWTFGYLQDEIGMHVHYGPIIQEIEGKKFFIAHGDAIGPVPAPTIWMKKVFDSKLLQWFFARLHPNFSFGLANKFSGVSRENNLKNDNSFKGEDKEELILFSKEVLKNQEMDFFIFGHRHLLLDLPIQQGRFITLGDWVTMFSYGVLEDKEFKLLSFQN